MQRSKLTIAIPTYNRSAYLDGTLKIFIDEARVNLNYGVEILVFNNGSTDDTRQIVEKWSKIYPIKYIESSVNIGPDKNLIKCYENSNGAYVWCFGDDDIPLAGALGEVDNLIAADKFGIILLNYKACDRTGEILISDNFCGMTTNVESAKLRDAFSLNGVITSVNLISACILKTDCFRGRDIAKYANFKSAYPQLGVVLDCFSDQPLFYLRKPILTWRHGNSSDNRYQYETFLGIMRMFAELINSKRLTVDELNRITQVWGMLNGRPVYKGIVDVFIDEFLKYCAINRVLVDGYANELMRSVEWMGDMSCRKRIAIILNQASAIQVLRQSIGLC